MITKEEALSDKYNPQSSAIDTSDVHLMDCVFYGMQLFAKEISVEFAKFIEEIMNEKRKMPKPKMTWDELFELFIQSINQNAG